MLKKLITLSLVLISFTQLDAIGGSFPTTYHTDKDGCKHEVMGGWENQEGWSTDFIRSCPNPKDPRIGTYTQKTWGGRASSRGREIKPLVKSSLVKQVAVKK